METSITQDNIETDGGDVAGRDLNKTTNIYNTPPQRSQLLLQKLRNGIDPSQKKYLKDLEHLMTEKVDEDIRGLEKKLEQGNRQDLIEYALEAKERYHKMLVSSSTLVVELEMHAYLLLEVRSRFQTVYSKIYRGCSDDEVNNEIQKLLDDVCVLLEDDPLELSRAGVDGMIYYLTGNCHLKWHK